VLARLPPEHLRSTFQELLQRAITKGHTPPCSVGLGPDTFSAVELIADQLPEAPVGLIARAYDASFGSTLSGCPRTSGRPLWRTPCRPSTSGGFLERERSGLAVELADCAERLNPHLTKSELSQLMRTIHVAEGEIRAIDRMVRALDERFPDPAVQVPDFDS
jgi:hypothetical protein